MSLPVSDTEFWRQRIAAANASGREVHAAIYDIDPGTWDYIQNCCGHVLRAQLREGMMILDAACGYGALYDQLPYGVTYHGIDISPDLIAVAKERHPGVSFDVGDLTDLSRFRDNRFEMVVCCSVRRMIVSNRGAAAWAPMEAELRRVSRGKLLFIEYDKHFSYSLE